jgi:hypothetical protein
MGLPAEVDRAVEALHDTRDLDVIEVNGPHPNRGDSHQVRMYLEARLTEWCGRSWHDGDCCAGSRQQWGGVRVHPVQQPEQATGELT